MYLFYVDESGSPYSYSPTNEFFIVATIIIEDSVWDELHNAMQSLKRKFFQGDLSLIEIKGSDIWNSKNSFVGFDDAKIDQFLSELFLIISNVNLRISSTVVRKQQFIFLDNGKDMLTEGWKYLLERFEMFLTGEGQRQYGLVIMDSIDRDADRRKSMILDGFKMSGTGYVNLDHILEITFTDSVLKNVIQLTDVVAYIINLHKRKDTQADVEKYWNVIETKFIRDRFGNYNGAGYKELP